MSEALQRVTFQRTSRGVATKATSEGGGVADEDIHRNMQT
jgi:hypothetical protein